MIAGNWVHWHLRCGYQTMPPGYPPRHHVRTSRPEVRVGSCDHRQERAPAQQRLLPMRDLPALRRGLWCHCAHAWSVHPWGSQGRAGEWRTHHIHHKARADDLVDDHTVWPVDLGTGSRLGRSPPVAVEGRSVVVSRAVLGHLEGNFFNPKFPAILP